jgi:hypothetical protein
MTKQPVQPEAGRSAPAPVCRLLDDMGKNPGGDWVINDVQTLCRQTGLVCSSPKRGSHYKISSKHLPGILTIPARKPIKPFYIKMLTALARAHTEQARLAGE